MHVPVGRPLFGEIEKKYANDAIEKVEISGLFGEYIPKFESAFADFCGVSDAVAVNGGTAALHLAVAALNIGEGDEVLVSSLTNMASFFAVLYQGATPIPIDSEPDTLNLDPNLLEEKITPRTKAIMVVHLYGHPVDMDPVLAIAKKHNLYVIEDAAEAHGAEYKGKRTGSFGDIGCFSFFANKVITTGEGGMLTMNDSKLAARARSLKSLAFGKENKFMHEDIGYNYRMSNVQAAIGAAQMTHVDEILDRKKKMAAYYLTHLADIGDIQLPVERPDCINVYWMFNIILTGALAGKREKFMALLKERGVETRPDFIPFSDQEIFIKKGLTEKGECPVATNAGVNGLYIPSGTDISEEEQAYVVKNIHEVVAELTT